jgi:hypothetical protein
VHVIAKSCVLSRTACGLNRGYASPATPMPLIPNRLRSVQKLTWLKLAITVSALACVAARIIWPDLKIDAITLGLLVVAVLPWLAALIESAKFPGGWEVKFRDVQQAGAKVTGSPEAAAAAAPTQQTNDFLASLSRDPNLALVGLRIEIEKRLRRLARQHGIPENQPPTRLVRELQSTGALSHPTVSGLQELIMAGNQAAHGARVQEGVAEWAAEYGPQVLSALDGSIQDA